MLLLLLFEGRHTFQCSRTLNAIKIIQLQQQHMDNYVCRQNDAMELCQKLNYLQNFTATIFGYVCVFVHIQTQRESQTNNQKYLLDFGYKIPYAHVLFLEACVYECVHEAYPYGAVYTRMVRYGFASHIQVYIECIIVIVSCCTSFQSHRSIFTLTDTLSGIDIYRNIFKNSNCYL